MNTDGLKLDVIQKIGDGVNPDDIILTVCHRTGWDWPQAEAFVEEIDFSEQEQITNRRLGLRWVLMLFFLVGGTGVIVFSSMVMLMPVMRRWGDVFLHPIDLVRELGMSIVVGYSMLTLGISMVVGAILSGLTLFRSP